MIMLSRTAIRNVAVLAAACLLVAVTATAFPRATSLPVTSVRIVNRFPHDADAFCQGLVVADGQLFEGTGLQGSSSLRQVQLETGQIQRIVPLAREYFGEGITVHQGRIYQITWQNRLAIVYDKESFAPVSSFRYSGEGWGLTTDGESLFMSDGTSTLRVLDPATFDVTRRLSVRAGSSKVDKLNELEYVNGEILANIWYSDRIARISPKTGDVLGWIDCSQLYPAKQRPSREHVLNGIAYDATNRRLFVTGKHWPRLFEIELQP